MSGVLYIVKDWDKNFENNRTQELAKLSWVPIPNKHDGEGYSYMMIQEHCVEYFCAWNLIVQVASKCEPRGYLLRSNSKPHDPESLALRTRAPQRIFELALPFFASEDIEWLDKQDMTEQLELFSQEGASVSQDVAHNRKKGKNRKKGIERKKDVGSVPEELRELELYKVDVKLCESFYRLMMAWKESMPYLDILVEIKKAHAWEMENPKCRKKARGRFLGNWLRRSDADRAKRPDQRGQSREERIKVLAEVDAE